MKLFKHNENNKKGKLFIISGVSGVGKNTIIKKLFEDKKLLLAFSISMTTRQPRFDETNGVNYFFVTKEKFEEAIKNNELLEYAEFCGNLYGTPKNYVHDKLEEGTNVILEIEVKGAMNVMQQEPEAISIFILPPSLEALEERLKARGTESDDTIFHRIEEAKKELRYKEHYDHIVVNDDLEEAVAEIKKIIKSGKKN